MNVNHDKDEAIAMHVVSTTCDSIIVPANRATKFLTPAVTDQLIVEIIHGKQHLV